MGGFSLLAYPLFYYPDMKSNEGCQGLEKMTSSKILILIIATVWRNSRKVENNRKVNKYEFKRSFILICANLTVTRGHMISFRDHLCHCTLESFFCTYFRNRISSHAVPVSMPILSRRYFSFFF